MPGATSSVHCLEEQVDDAYEPTSEELRDYAEWLGMDPLQDGDLLWIARRGLKTPLPKPWRPFEAASGDIFFYNPDTGESQWDHPCDHELRQLYAAEKAKQQLDPGVLGLGTPGKDLSVSSICEETSPRRSFDDFTEQTPSPQSKASSIPAEDRGLAALAASAAKACTVEDRRRDPACSIRQTQLMPERPSKPPPSRLRPPRPKPLQLECDDAAFCRSPAACSPEQPEQPEPKQTTPSPGKEPADRVAPGDVQSPPTPRLSAVLTAELCSRKSEAGDRCLWNRLEGEETLCQLPQSQRGDSHNSHSLSSVNGDSLEISSLTAVLEGSNIESDSFSRGKSEVPSQKKQPGLAEALEAPTGRTGSPAAAHSELRRLRKQLESTFRASDVSNETSSPQSPGGKPEADIKEETQHSGHSHEKPVQDSTTQTDETTTASTTEAEHLSKAADSPGEELSPLQPHSPLQPRSHLQTPADENIPLSIREDAEVLSVKKSMASLAAELSAVACKTAERSKLSDTQRKDSCFLRDVTNKMHDLPEAGLKLPTTPRTAGNWMDITSMTNMRMQLELQEQQRTALERQVDECLSTYSMEQAAHAATKAALRESQREVLRLQSQVQFKETETQRLEMELQRCQSELGCVFSQAKQAQLQLKAQQAELAQVKMRLSQNEPRPKHTPSRAVCSSAMREPKLSSEAPTQLTHESADNANVGDVAESTLRRCQSFGGSSGARLTSEVSDALRKRRRELRKQHAVLEQERRQWRLDARSLRSQSADATAEDLVRARAALDARASALNQSICEYRALQRALTSGSLHQDAP